MLVVTFKVFPKLKRKENCGHVKIYIYIYIEVIMIFYYKNPKREYMELGG